MDFTPTYFLSDLLDVDLLGDDVFLGHRIESSQGRVFGGQVLAQALMAATKTVDENKKVHSCHNYFIRPGDCDLPIHFKVHRDLDGRSFSNRRVVAMQNDKPIFTLTASFQGKEAGYEYQIDMPEVPPPEQVLNENELAIKYQSEMPEKLFDALNRYRTIELKPIDEKAHFIRGEKSNQQMAWIKAREDLPSDQSMHRGVLAYATDLTLLSTCARPHELVWWDQHLSTASIDHALWFHSDKIQMNDWHLYVMDTPWSGGGRGLNRGSIFNQEGLLVASVMQEGLIRLKES